MVGRLVFAIAFIVLIGCATRRPVFYPNEQFKRAGSAVAESDTTECMQRAGEYVAADGRVGSAVKGVATESATSATIGAAAGAAGGAIVGRAGTAAAVGAAGGGAAGATRSLIHGLTGKRSPSPVYRNFVDRCLRDKGYDPIGWQ